MEALCVFSLHFSSTNAPIIVSAVQCVATGSDFLSDGCGNGTEEHHKSTDVLPCVTPCALFLFGCFKL